MKNKRTIWFISAITVITLWPSLRLFPRCGGGCAFDIASGKSKQSKYRN